jgi:hypothetical protein
MPPKKQPGGPSKKEAEKKKAKAIEDKTFGLKNKKGAKMQKYIQQVEASIRNAGPNRQAGAKKKDEDDDLKDLNKLFKPVQTMPKVADDVDPKSVLCVFFKQGLCQKGNKCKYSHDLATQQKTAKRNLYVDSRETNKDGETEAETNENWDEQQLIEVAEKKHGEADRKRPNQTEIICKYFLDAVEENKYGWFWECPNGSKCIYKHALPPGYVLKKDRKKLEELKKLETISLEELIEKERAALSAIALTKVTLQTFIAWKKKKLAEKKKKAAEEEKQKKANLKIGKQGGMSGRDLFTYNPDLVGDDDEEAGGDDIEREPEDQEDDIKAFEIDERTFYNIGEGGEMLDEGLDDVVNNEASEDVTKPTVFNENLFDDADIPDESDDDEEEDESQASSSKTKSTAENLERLKI